MLKPVMRGLIGITMIFAVARDARAEVQILKPDQPVAGHTQLFWAQTWWQWLDSIPAATNPLTDSTGDFAAVGNNGDVFFLAGTQAGAATRTIRVPFGKPVLFPVISFAFFPFASPGNGAFDPSPCRPPLKVSCAVDQVTSLINKATKMTVKIDNITLDTTTHPKINSFRETSTSLFQVFLPRDNLLGVPAGSPIPFKLGWAEDGYWIMLSNLSVGTHRLHFHAEIPAFSFFVDVTDTLNVVETEPERSLAR